MRTTLKTFILMSAMTALVGGIGLLAAGTGGMAIALAMAGAMNVASWWFSDKIVLALYGAHEVKDGRAYEITRELVQKAGIPMPRVCMVDAGQPNAFATGRNPKHSAVAITTGLMEILDDRELRGVISHELSHITNRDTLLMTVTATMAGTLSMISNVLIWGGGKRSGLAVAAGLFSSMVLAPLAQLAVSRTREYAADYSGAALSGDPEALASALRRIEQTAHGVSNRVAENNPATASMFIINPLSGKAGGADNWFSTHPKTENRVKQLYNQAAQMKQAPNQDGEGASPAKAAKPNGWPV